MNREVCDVIVVGADGPSGWGCISPVMDGYEVGGWVPLPYCPLVSLYYAMVYGMSMPAK